MARMDTDVRVRRDEQRIKPIERVPAAWDFQQRIEPIERIL